MTKKEAVFIDRDHCISCGDGNLKELSGGLFGDAPLREFIENDPWGENPMPYIEHKKWSYVQCINCRQMFHRYILSNEWNEVRFSEWMTQEAMEKFEESIQTPASDFNKAKQHVEHILRIEKMSLELRGDSPVRILDFGCGWGEFLAMCERFGFSGYGIDRSSERRQQGKHLNIFPEIEELVMEEGSTNFFHVITLFEVLEHLDEPLILLKSLSRLLAPGGILIVETPDCSDVTDIKDEMSYRKIHPLDHINGFTPDTLRNIVQRAGFRSVQPHISHVSTDRTKVIKTEIKQLLAWLTNDKIQQYFQKK
ncbi:MAG: class I SAM-dependent methyltransferase [Nitrospira sp.]|nr:class I SAM-dependent methyltransferase [bacterium]MBL7048289.1 class I SAM-dependent methyltransferase [Nitrospira sp.]